MSDNKNGPLFADLTVEEAPIKWELNLKDLPDGGIEGEKQAGPEELQDLTKMLNDEHELEVKSFACSYHVKPTTLTANKDVGGCLIEGCLGHFELRAELRQTCIISLERIDTVVLEEFDQQFSAKGGHRPRLAASAEGEMDDLYAEEPAMALIKGKVELGPLVYQYLSMAIDANPRKSGAQYTPEQDLGDKQVVKPASPFVVLENFKHKK